MPITDERCERYYIRPLLFLCFLRCMIHRPGCKTAAALGTPSVVVENSGAEEQIVDGRPGYFPDNDQSLRSPIEFALDLRITQKASDRMRKRHFAFMGLYS